ncbi:dimethylsulfone monooxygenase, partial [Lecanoromycetidae sp. Uapishka_2]
MVWLEQLLVAQILEPPEVAIAEGGLQGINEALDKLRNGAISGKRIVVPIETEGKNNLNGHTMPNRTNGTSKAKSIIDDIEYADKLNADPSRIKFAYWVPNVSGGLVISKIEMRTKWDLDSNAQYAKTAERYGFDKGRIAVNVVSGWFKQEFTSIGQWWLDHGERYRRSREFIACLKGIWTQDQFNFSGDFYQFHDYPLRPKPLARSGRPYPEIFQGGNSEDARENAAVGSDYYFMNGNTLEGFQTQIKDVKERAKQHGREGQVKFAVNSFVIARETEEEAIRVLQEIQGKANKEAVEAFQDAVKNAGASTSNKTGMWADSKFEDLVQYNDGFKTKLIGTPEQIADRILLLKSLGINILLIAFLHYDGDIQQFGEQVLSLVRKLEAEGRGKDEELEISLTGDVYKARESVK